VPQIQVFSPFKEAVVEGVHNLASDALKVALTNTAPTVNNAVLADIVQIAPDGGYAPAAAALVSSGQIGGTYSLQLDVVTFTATGASFGEFRYAVLFNDTAAAKNLIAFFDYGVPYTLPAGQSFSVNAGTWLTNA
jgi:hypothetical protein